MTATWHNDESGLLDQYLDGLLDETQHRAFEARLSSDTALRAECDLQRRMDEALSRIIVPPPPVWVGDFNLLSARDGWAGPVPISPGKWQTLRRHLAVAAVLVMGAIGVWRIYHFVNPPVPRDPYAPRPWMSLEQTYHAEAGGTFTPDWICENDRQFASAYRRTLGQALLLETPPDGVEAVGLAYRNTISETTVVLLGRAAGEPVMVFADRLDRDPGQSLPPESGLNLFRRTVGDLVLYEVSPHDRPFLLDLFYAPR